MHIFFLLQILKFCWCGCKNR